MQIGLRLSLAANVLLLAAVVALAWRWHSAAPIGGGATQVVAETRAQPRSAAASLARSAAVDLNPAAAAEFERFGISRETLTEVVLQDYERRANEALSQLEKRYAPALIPERELVALSRQRDVGRERAIREALGEEAYRAWDKNQALDELNFRRLRGDRLSMSADETERAYRMQKDFDEKTKAIQMAFEDGVADKSDADALRARANQELDDALTRLLGAERVAQLRGPMDPTGHVDGATEARQNWGDLNPTADQAAAVARAEAGYRRRESELAKEVAAQSTDPGVAANELAQMAAAREQTYRDTFGPDAYAAHQRAHDPTYQALTRYAEAWNLQPGEIEQVYSSVDAFEQHATRLRTAAALRAQAGSPVDWNAVNAAIEQLKQETSATIGAAVGPDRLRRMEANGLF